MKTTLIALLASILWFSSCTSKADLNLVDWNSLVGPPYIACSNIKRATLELDPSDFGNFRLYKFISKDAHQIKVRGLENKTLNLELSARLAKLMMWDPEKLRPGDWVVATCYELQDGSVEMIAYDHIRKPRARKHRLKESQLSTVLPP